MAQRIATPSRPAASPVITPARAPRSVLHDDAYGTRRLSWRSPIRIGLVVAAVVTLAIHVVANAVSPYGVHRDELLYLAMGHHLQFWAMDFPPGIGLTAALTHTLLGDSLVAIRLPSAFAAAALVALAYALARLFGGRGRACVLAGLAVLASPLFLRAGTLFQPVVLDELWWTIGLAALARIGALTYGVRPRPALPHETRRTPEAGAWIALGLAGGLGLLTKFSILIFAAAVAIGLLATPLRRTLSTRWPWIALGIALVIGSASVVGQIRLGWPLLGQMAELREGQLSHFGPLAFLLGQLLLGPSIALAGLGLWFLLRDPDAARWRPVAWACAAAFVLVLVTGGKAYYVAPIYPTLFAAGAVAFHRSVQRRPIARDRAIAWGAAYAVVTAYGLLTLPFGLPLLPPATMARYAAAFGSLGTATNTGGRLALPQDYADMLGWPQQVAAVDAVFDSLPDAQRRDAVLVARNYGEAGALDFYGPRVGLPPVVSPAGSFWFFGPGGLPGTTVITVGIPIEELHRFFRRVRPVGEIRHRYLRWVVDEERHVPVAIAEDPIQTLQDVWPSLKPR